MDINFVRSVMSDELRKIAEVRLDGLSPETLLSLRAPEPMETRGLGQAREILARAEMPKLANVPSLPSIEEEAAQDRKINQGRSLGKSVLTGAGVGRILSEVSLKTSGNISPLRRTVGTALGAAGGLVDNMAERRYQRRKAERDVFRRQLAAQGRANTAPVAAPPAPPPAPAIKTANVLPSEILRYEEERNIREMAAKNRSIDADKLRSKVRAMRRGALVGGVLAPAALMAMALKKPTRAMLKADWAASPIKAGLTYGSALVGLAGLGAKSGSLIASKAHDFRHGPIIKEKRSSVQDPSYRLKKSQRAFSARDALTAIRNETVVPRKP